MNGWPGVVAEGIDVESDVEVSDGFVTEEKNPVVACVVVWGTKVAVDVADEIVVNVLVDGLVT